MHMIKIHVRPKKLKIHEIEGQQYKIRHSTNDTRHQWGWQVERNQLRHFKKQC